MVAEIACTAHRNDAFFANARRFPGAKLPIHHGLSRKTLHAPIRLIFGGQRRFVNGLADVTLRTGWTCYTPIAIG
jgi:hypothetical protein